MTTTIAEQSAATQAAARVHLPSEVSDAFDRAVAGWRETEVPSGVVRVGDVLPETTLLDVSGNEVSLADRWIDGPLVVVFYRGGWCPYCNIALRTYQKDLLPELDRLGAALVAISPQTPDQSLSTREKAELAFTVLSDPGSAVARQMGITFEQTDEVKAAQRTLGLDLADVNVGGSTELPMPTVLVVDTSGTVTFVDVHPDYTSRTEVPPIVEAVQATL
jgi:peroxiredoxin